MNGFAYSLDVAVFRSINHGLSSPWLDHFFAIITNIWNFKYVLVPWLVYLMLWGGRPGRRTVAGLFLAVILADLVCAHLLKDWVGRVRPCNALADALTPTGRRTSFSFPSTHGATMGAAALVLSLGFRRWTALWAVYATLVAVSRVYLGLHYPSDVIAGLALGSVIGLLVFMGLDRLFPLAPDSSRSPAAGV
jgi:undecaprenyl-diphosphatase